MAETPFSGLLEQLASELKVPVEKLKINSDKSLAYYDGVEIKRGEPVRRVRFYYDLRTGDLISKTFLGNN